MNDGIRKVPRWFAARWAGPAVAAARLGVRFESVWIAAPPELAGGLNGLDAPPGRIAGLVALAGPFAETRTRGWSLQDLARRSPGALSGVDVGLEGEIRTLFNAPKVWSGVNAIAGALQARKIVGYCEAREILGRMGALE